MEPFGSRIISELIGKIVRENESTYLYKIITLNPRCLILKIRNGPKSKGFLKKCPNLVIENISYRYVPIPLV